MSAIGSVIVMAWWPSSPRFPRADLRRGRWAPVAPSSSGVARLPRWETGLGAGLSPARFGDAGQLAAVGHGPETDPAQPEPPVHRPWAAAPCAPGVGLHLELRLAPGLGDQCLLRHWSVLLERESEPP